MQEIRLMSPGKNGTIINEYGIPEKPPEDWAFLPSGDAALTKKTTSKGACWRIQVKKGRRLQSLGIWAPKSHIAAAQKEVEAMRTAPDYEKKKANAAKARDKKQAAYVETFEKAIINHLNFHVSYKPLETKMAKLVTAHAIPVGSGTVARTQMIPIEDRASKAVTAWMRHKTTNYDQMKIARVKGERRSVRRQLAGQSKSILESYRKGLSIDQECPLFKVLSE